MKSVLITGATGLVGSYAIPVINRSWSVVTLNRSSVEIPGTRNIACDLSRPVDSSILPKSIDAVVHLAQSERFRDFPGGARDTFNINTARALELIDYARASGARSFIYASSGAIYGNSKDDIREDYYSPRGADIGFYAASKFSAELLIRQFEKYINVIIIRFFFVYGFGQRRTMLLPRVVDNIKNRVPINLDGRYGLEFNPIHASDAAGALNAALDLAQSDVINVAGPRKVTLKEVCNIVSSAIGVEAVYKYSNSEGSKIVANIDRMNRKLISPNIDIVSGINDVI